MAINQTAVKVMFFIPGYKIKGTVYMHREGRLSDFLNMANKTFIPITEVNIYSEKEEKLLYKVPFMNLNRTYIISGFPEEGVEEIIKEQETQPNHIIAKRRVYESNI